MIVGLIYAIRNYLNAREDLHASGQHPTSYAAISSVEFWAIVIVVFVLNGLAGVFTIAQREGEYRPLVIVALILGGWFLLLACYFYDRQTAALRTMLTPPEGAPKRRSTDA